MKVGILSSSRADYGIYFPLLTKLKEDNFFELEIIAFGSHLSKSHGYTIRSIEEDDYDAIHRISSLLSNDDQQAIATSYGLTCLKFADFWQNNKYDLVFSLGDRFEMSGAVQAGIPFGVNFAHIHGGETTLGAIDNIYRHQITLASNLHFTATEAFAERVKQLAGSSTTIYAVGALSLDGIENFKPIEKELFYKKFNIPEREFALITFHPETVASTENFSFAKEMRKALSHIIPGLFLIITMPNADALGSIYREEIEKLRIQFPSHVLCIENFGRENYFSAMYYAKLLIGNTSSGILEAASFGKYVVNVGDRQKGRMQSENVLNANFEANDIISAVNLAPAQFGGGNVYHKINTADTIIEIIKSDHVAL